MKIGAKVVRHGRYVIFQMAEVAIPRDVFWNRRRHTATAFDTLLGIGTRLRPADYRDIVGQRG